MGLMILTLAVLEVTITCSICYDRADDIFEEAIFTGHTYSLLHLECHFFNFKSQSIIYVSRSLLPRSVEKRQMRKRLEIEIEIEIEIGDRD